MIHMASPLIGFSYYVWAVPLVNLLAALLIFFLFRRNLIINLTISAAAAIFSLLAGAMLAAERFVADMPMMESDWLTILNLEKLDDPMPVGLLSDGLAALFLMLISLIILILKLYAPAYFKYAYLRLNGPEPSEAPKSKNSREADFNSYWQVPANKFSAHLTFWHCLVSALVFSNDLWQSFIIIQLLGLNTFNLLDCQIEKSIYSLVQRMKGLSEDKKLEKLFRKTYSFIKETQTFGIKYHLAGFVLMLLGAGCLHISLGSVTFSHIAAVDTGKITLLSALALLLTAAGLGVQLYTALIRKVHKTEIRTHIPSKTYIPHLPAEIVAVILHSCAGLYLLFRLFPLVCRENSLMPAAAIIIAAGTAIAVIYALAALNSRKLDEILILLTLSQWGLVLLTLGSGSLSAAFFHTAAVSLTALLLFLASGSVLLRAGSRNLGALGNLRGSMFYTWLACLFGGLSWLGIPPLLGFFSIYGILCFTCNCSLLTLPAFTVICLTQAAHLFVLLKAYRLTFESEASPQESDPEPPSQEINPGLWALPIALNSIILALGLTDIPYAWGLPMPSLYEDFMTVSEMKGLGSPWPAICVYLLCCGAALYLSFRFRAGEKVSEAQADPEQSPKGLLSVLPLINN